MTPRPRLAAPLRSEKSARLLASLDQLEDEAINDALELTRRSGGDRWVVKRIHVMAGEVTRQSKVERAHLEPEDVPET